MIVLAYSGIYTRGGGNLEFSLFPYNFDNMFYDLVMYNIIVSEVNHFVFSLIHLIENKHINFYDKNI